ncbi:MAG: aldo/keto reductase [Stappiaceae bacterium]
MLCIFSDRSISDQPLYLLSIPEPCFRSRGIRLQIHAFKQFGNKPTEGHCKEQGIAIPAYSLLARGAVADDPVPGTIADELGATASQVALAFLLAEGYVIIPSSGTPRRISDNIAATELDLSPEHIAMIRKRDEGVAAG